MEDRFPAAGAAFKKRGKTVHWRTKIMVSLDDGISIPFHDKLQKFGNVVKMIIKCIPVQLTYIYNVLNCNFAEWFLFQQLPEGIYNYAFRMVHMINPLLKELDHYTMKTELFQWKD